MSNIAQSRDLSDPKTIRDFADIVQSPERLKLLLLLTVADIRAVGPGVWNGWKGQLLRTLYYETEPLVAGGHTQVQAQPAHRRGAGGAAQGARRLAGGRGRALHRAPLSRLLAAHRDRSAGRARQAVCGAPRRKACISPPSTRPTPSPAITELTVFAPNHPRLLALFAGACAAAGANIAGAHITTTRDGYALDTFLLEPRVQRRRGRDAARHAASATRSSGCCAARSGCSDLLAERGAPPRRIKAFTVEPEVIINNALSDQFTVIEVAGRDRPGLLYELTSTLSDLLLDITSAHITTFGEKAVDVFYVTDLTGKKVDARAAPGRRSASGCEKVLEGEPPESATERARKSLRRRRLYAAATASTSSTRRSSW